MAAQYDDLTHISWKDTAFLQMYGLGEHNIMDYFSLSPFYDPSSINEQIRMQARFNQFEASQMDKKQMTGIDYDAVLASTAPILFIITKGMRRSPTVVDLVAAYSVIEGTIYQTPDLYTLLSNRILTSLHFVQEGFDAALSDYRYHPSLGYYWKRDQERYERELEANKDKVDQQRTLSRGGYGLMAMDELISDTLEMFLKPVEECEEREPPPDPIKEES
ncbi:MED6 mediator sub complex component-domain-containing protein [Phlyctochytrium arcticum]|nr:MED6 mediator sub complex component-domain-containing protein [Phlyctochytrium arcticum]